MVLAMEMSTGQRNEMQISSWPWVGWGQGSGVLGTHSGMVLDDISLLKASWYLRLSTSFFIWGTSHSSMPSGASEVASLGLEDTGRSNSRGLPACSHPPAASPLVSPILTH